jgi:hypothetical protein
MSKTYRSSETHIAGEAMPTGATPDAFITTDLDLAAYLKTIGRRLIGNQRQGRFVAFIFEPAAKTDAEKYLTGSTAPAQSVLANYRELRTLIVNTERHNKYAHTSKSGPF